MLRIRRFEAIQMEPHKNAASSIYNNRLSQRQQSLRQWMGRARVAGHMRGVVGILIPATVWLALVPHMVSAWLAIIPAATFLALHKYYEHTYIKLNRAKRGIAFYEQGIGRLEN